MYVGLDLFCYKKKKKNRELQTINQGKTRSVNHLSSIPILYTYIKYLINQWIYKFFFDISSEA